MSQAGQEDEAPAQESKTPAEEPQVALATPKVAPEPSAQAAPILQQASLPLAAPVIFRSTQNWRYSFADFVVGPTNNMAVAAAQDVSRRHLVQLVSARIQRGS